MANERAIKVNAGAGSGKTFTMTYLFWKLVNAMLQKGESVNDILKSILVTSFTNAGVSELIGRIAAALAKYAVSADQIQAATFDGLYFQWVQDNYKLLGFPEMPKLLTAEWQKQYVEDILVDKTIPGIDYSRMSFDVKNGDTHSWVIDIVATCFNTIQTYHLYGQVDAEDKLYELIKNSPNAGGLTETAVNEIYNIYKDFDDRLKAENLLTFSHMQGCIDQLLKVDPDFIKNQGYKFLIVDEFQDTNEYQIGTIKEIMAGKDFQKAVFVGDDNQAIYSFRDTTPDYIINLEKYLGEPVKELFLLENRRSTPEIIEPANKLIELNEDRVIKDLVPTRDHGKKVSIKGYHDTRSMHEAKKNSEEEDIAAQIIEMIKSGEHKAEDIAVIGRKRGDVYKIGTLLSEAGIPWVSKNPMNLLENSKVQAALALSDAFYNPDISTNYLAYLTAKYDGKIMEVEPAIVKSEMNQLQEMFTMMDAYSFEEQQDAFHKLLNDLKYDKDEIYEYFLDLLYANEDLPSELAYTRVFKKYGNTMEKKMDQKYNGVTLVTAHSSKGLEWPVVFLTLSSWDNPHLHRNTKKGYLDLEESRRLLFVAMTRARDELYISGKYNAYGTEKDGYTYNQFLHDLYVIQDMTFDPTDYDKLNRRAEKEEKARKEKYERRKKQDDFNVLFSNKKKSNGEMSEEDIKAYNKLVLGSKQMSLADFV